MDLIIKTKGYIKEELKLLQPLSSDLNGHGSSLEKGIIDLTNKNNNIICKIYDKAKNLTESRANKKMYKN